MNVWTLDNKLMFLFVVFCQGIYYFCHLPQTSSLIQAILLATSIYESLLQFTVLPLYYFVFKISWVLNVELTLCSMYMVCFVFLLWIVFINQYVVFKPCNVWNILTQYNDKTNYYDKFVEDFEILFTMLTHSAT